jgi:hypothetical protein
MNGDLMFVDIEKPVYKKYLDACEAPPKEVSYFLNCHKLL